MGVDVLAPSLTRPITAMKAMSLSSLDVNLNNLWWFIPKEMQNNKYPVINLT